ncbi:hypothetical protein F4604DRAFT_1938263 [Suillus subluteus]|nr:hypothetical protein F4604DRAFT_1938263 [Suillus subluteus]
MMVGTLEEIVDDNNSVTSTANDPESYILIMSFVDKDRIEPGCSVLLNHENQAVVDMLEDNTDPLVSVMKLDKALKEKESTELPLTQESTELPLTHHTGCVTIHYTPNFEVVSAPALFLLTTPSMSYLYEANDFDANGDFISTTDWLDLLPGGEGMPPNPLDDGSFPVSNAGSRQFPLFDKVNWDDPNLYTMPLTKDELLALTYDVAASNVQTNIPTYPELPPARTPSPQPFSPELLPACTPSPQHFVTSSHDEGSPGSTEAEVLDASRESLREANVSSWAARNPLRAIIHPQMPPPRLMDAQKASRKIKRDQKIERTKRLHDAVAEYLDAQKTNIEALSWAHYITPKQINNIIGNQTRYRTSRKSQLIHALVHAKAKEMNAGSQYSMAKLCKMVMTDPETKNLTKKQKEAYIAALEEHHERKVDSKRDDLQVCTGVYGTLFIIHSHINNTIQSAMHGTDNSEDFWEDVYEHPMADFLRQYKQWACTQNQNLNEHDSLEAIRKQVHKVILRGLNIVMNYSNYEMSIVETYGVHLVGWPDGVKFISPSNIGTIGDIHKLWDALKACTCYWTTLSPAEVKAHASELATRRSAGEVVQKP